VGYNLTWVELVDGLVGDKKTNGTVYNPNGGAKGPRIGSDGSLFSTAYRTSQLNGACAKTTASGSQQASTLWSVHSDTNPESPRLAVGPTGTAVLYQSKESNGSYNVTTWHLGFYGKAGGWSSTKISNWYSEFVGSATELAVLPDGEILIFTTTGSVPFAYRSSKDQYATEHPIPGVDPDDISTALGPDGTLHVVTAGYVNMVGYQAQHRTLKNGTWSAPTDIGDFGDTMVALDDLGNPHVVGTDSAGVVIWTRVGEAWQQVASFSYDEGGYGTPSLAIDAHGRYHVTLSAMGYSPPKFGFYYVMLCPDLN